MKDINHDMFLVYNEKLKRIMRDDINDIENDLFFKMRREHMMLMMILPLAKNRG